jgi:uncharacterized protein (UPF0264 family)
VIKNQQGRIESAKTGGRDSDAALFSAPSIAPLLLISVRDRTEISCVLESGVDILDLKEPGDGPLAPVDRQLWQSAASEVDAWARERPRHHKPLLSAALGESEQAARIAADVPAAFAFAKVGPSGCRSPVRLQRTWDDVRRTLCGQVELVAVAYADWQQADCLPPEAVFEQAVRSGMRRCLIDTFVKDGSSTLQHLSWERLQAVVTMASEYGLWWALAGSIRREHLSQLSAHAITPDCIGLRGDVCDSDRTGKIDLERVRGWQLAVQQYRIDPRGIASH